jgi:peptidoglycan/LPS O-acetylase OafA/YrhL
MDEQNGEYRLGYRPDVEGLRAVAILLVVAAHAGVRILKGGFVGVDVFYILSGYLITGLLVQEATTTGHLGFARFYARRLRRLLPGLLLMLAVTCGVALLVLPPTELPIQAANAASAALWLSNFQFAFWDWDYFAPSSDTALFLHTWSLGVEEQFYLVWPLMVVLAMGAWKRVVRAPTMSRLKWLFVGIFIASFALSLYWTYHRPAFAFYLMPSRAWQFALGAIVFLVAGSPAFDTHPSIGKSAWLRPAGWLGLTMILFGAWIINPAGSYPGGWALLPSFGAALVLAAGAYKGNVGVHRVLSWRPMQALGRVSYSWYLWHGPVLRIGTTLLDTSNGWTRILLVVLSLLIAAASYHLFETPIRRKRRLVARPRWAIVGALAVMAVAEAGVRGWQVDSENYVRKTPALARFVAARTDESVIYAKGCFGSYASTKVQICTFGSPAARHTAVVLGDSKAAQWVPAVGRIFDKPDWRLLVVTKSACPMVDAPYLAPSLRREYTECARWRRDAVSQIAALRADVVIITESVTYPFTEKQWKSGTQHVLGDLARSTGRIYLIRPTPELAFNGRLCAEPRGRVYNALVSASRCTGRAHTAHFDDVGRWLDVAAAPFGNVRMVDMTSAVCPGGICRSILKDKIVFSDSGHMTATFARTLAPDLEEGFGPSEASSPSATGVKP